MTDNALRELYQEVILDHSRHPRHYGAMDHASHKAEGYNPLCGDRVTVTLALDDAGKVADIKFQGKGCAISQASASLMTDLVIGRSLADAGAPVRPACRGGRASSARSGARSPQGARRGARHMKNQPEISGIRRQKAKRRKVVRLPSCFC